MEDKTERLSRVIEELRSSPTFMTNTPPAQRENNELVILFNNEDEITLKEAPSIRPEPSPLLPPPTPRLRPSASSPSLATMSVPSAARTRSALSALRLFDGKEELELPQYKPDVPVTDSPGLSFRPAGPSAGAVPDASDALPTPPDDTPPPSWLNARPWLHSYSMKQQKVRELLKTGSLMIMATVAIGMILLYLRSVLVPLVLARFFVYILQPVVKFLESGKRPGCQKHLDSATDREICVCGPFTERRIKRVRSCFLFCHLPRGLAVALTIFLAFLVICGIAAIVTMSVVQLVGNIGKYEARAEEVVQTTLDLINSAKIVSAQTVLDALTAELEAILLDAVVIIYSIVTDGLLMFLFIIYILLEDEYVQPSKLKRDVDNQVRHYVVTKTAISAAVGICVGIILFSFQVDLALVFALLSFVLNFIPNLGSVIATLLPVPIVLLDPNQTWLTAGLAIGLVAATHMTIGNFVEPKVFGKTVDMHPVTVLAALVFWGSVWGVVGAILSVPLTAVLKVVLLHVDHPVTQFLGYLLLGKVSVYTSKNNKKEEDEKEEKVKLASKDSLREEDPAKTAPEHPSTV